MIQDNNVIEAVPIDVRNQVRRGGEGGKRAALVAAKHPLVICVVDDASALFASRTGSEVRGHWGTAAAFVAAARLALDQLRVGA